MTDKEYADKCTLKLANAMVMNSNLRKQNDKLIDALKIISHENSYIGHARDLAKDTLKELGF